MGASSGGHSRFTCINYECASVLEGDEAHLAEDSVEAGVGLASLSHEASKGHGLSLSVHLSLLVNLDMTQANLHRQLRSGRRRGRRQ